jgi:hypothetical protein
MAAYPGCGPAFQRVQPAESRLQGRIACPTIAVKSYVRQDTKGPRKNNFSATTWRRLSVCGVPTLRDVLSSAAGRRPDESGRGRHKCPRHMAHAQSNVKLFLRQP